MRGSGQAQGSTFQQTRPAVYRQTNAQRYPVCSVVSSEGNAVNSAQGPVHGMCSRVTAKPSTGWHNAKGNVLQVASKYAQSTDVGPQEGGRR